MLVLGYNLVWGVTPEFALSLCLQAFIQAFQPYKHQRQTAVCLSTHLFFVGTAFFFPSLYNHLSSTIWAPEMEIGIFSSRQTL